MRYVIGLTGGIACGKSVVSDIFAKQGIPIIDADIISKKLMQPGENCYNEVVLAFPDCVENGIILRNVLKQVVFSDSQKLAKLNSITHKHIKEECERQILSYDGVIVVVVPLMFESGFDKLCDCVLCVTSNEEERIKRIVNRDNISVSLAMSIISSQLSDKERCEKSDYILTNDGDMKSLEEKANNVLKTILEKEK